MDYLVLDHVVPSLSKKVPVEVAKVLVCTFLFVLLIPIVKQPFHPMGMNTFLQLTLIWEQGISLRKMQILSRGSLWLLLAMT